MLERTIPANHRLFNLFAPVRHMNQSCVGWLDRTASVHLSEYYLNKIIGSLSPLLLQHNLTLATPDARINNPMQCHLTESYLGNINLSHVETSYCTTDYKISSRNGLLSFHYMTELFNAAEIKHLIEQVSPAQCGLNTIDFIFLSLGMLVVAMLLSWLMIKYIRSILSNPTTEDISPRQELTLPIGMLPCKLRQPYLGRMGFAPSRSY